MGTNNTPGTADNSDTGVIPRAIKQIFETDSDIAVKVSFYEILNEQVYDLINPSGQRVPLAVRELPNQAIFKITQLTNLPVRGEKKTKKNILSCIRSVITHLVYFPSVLFVNDKKSHEVTF